VLTVLVLVVLCDDVWCCAGGIRANAFVTGGFLPEDRRGVREEGFMTTADWYATYAGLAGTGPVSSCLHVYRFYCSIACDVCGKCVYFSVG
jgi:hypothetical protein